MVTLIRKIRAFDIGRSSEYIKCARFGHIHFESRIYLIQQMLLDWQGSSLKNESTLHQLSPYIGKIKSSMAGSIVDSFTKQGDVVYDPYCGSSTIGLESWIAGRHAIAADLSPYAFVLSKAKLFPVKSIEDALSEIEIVDKLVKKKSQAIDLRTVPLWVRTFFHPETLSETISWSSILSNRRSYFLLACLLGILHHQRPGFLSYPSSHTVPYLREKKFPRRKYSELYEYRTVRERLENKVRRALKRVPELDYEIKRECHLVDSSTFVPKDKVDAVITSPPYMRQLDYGRDNRLRLWFVGLDDWKTLDSNVSPKEIRFLRMLKTSLRLWREVIKPKGVCVLVLGDTNSKLYGTTLPEVACEFATREVGGFSVLWKHRDPIPNERRVRRGYAGSLTETILVLKKQ